MTMRYRFYPTTDTTVDVTIEPTNIILGRQFWLYELSANDELIFSGDDLSTPRNRDEAAVVDDLLAFLCRSQADLDPEDFDDYTPAQQAWANSFACEALGSYVDDIEAIRGAQMFECIECFAYFEPSTGPAYNTEFCGDHCETAYREREEKDRQACLHCGDDAAFGSDFCSLDCHVAYSEDVTNQD